MTQAGQKSNSTGSTVDSGIRETNTGVTSMSDRHPDAEGRGTVIQFPGPEDSPCVVACADAYREFRMVCACGSDDFSLWNNGEIECSYCGVIGAFVWAEARQ